RDCLTWGPRNGPQTPQRSSRPGGAGALLGSAPGERGPRNGPHTPQRPSRPGGAGALLGSAPGERGPRNGPHTPHPSPRPGGAGALLGNARRSPAAPTPPVPPDIPRRWSHAGLGGGRFAGHGAVGVAW